MAIQILLALIHRVLTPQDRAVEVSRSVLALEETLISYSAYFVNSTKRQADFCITDCIQHDVEDNEVDPYFLKREASSSLTVSK